MTAHDPDGYGMVFLFGALAGYAIGRLMNLCDPRK